MENNNQILTQIFARKDEMVAILNNFLDTMYDNNNNTKNETTEECEAIRFAIKDEKDLTEKQLIFLVLILSSQVTSLYNTSQRAKILADDLSSFALELQNHILNTGVAPVPEIGLVPDNLVTFPG